MCPVTFPAPETSNFLLSVQLSTILRSKRFRGVGELRKTGERDFRCFTGAKKGTIAKERKAGEGEGKEKTLADKPLDFGNRPLDLSWLSVHNEIWCGHRLSERWGLVKICPKQRAHGTKKSNNQLMQAMKLQFQKLNLVISKKIFSILLKGRTF